MDKSRLSKFHPDKHPFCETFHLHLSFPYPLNLCMESFLFLPVIFLLFFRVSCISYTEFIYPNFSASGLQFVENSGAFLYSKNKTYKASILNPVAQQTKFYLCVIHDASNTITWSANRNSPISNSGKMMLTIKGLSVFDEDGNLKWSTPPLRASVHALKLTEMGNFVLLDQSNSSLWESFHHPTDTIVFGQYVPIGTQLFSSVSNSDLSSSNYSLSITASDAILQWYGQTYWKLSMEPKAYVNSNYMVEYMVIYTSGVYLLGQNGSAVVTQVLLSPADFRIAKLDSSGQFVISSFSGSRLIQEFVGASDNCRIPFFCGKFGLCTEDSPSNTPRCSCPSSFHTGLKNTSGCVPSDNSYTLPFSCNSTNNSTQLNSSGVSYLGLGSSIGYFSIDFSEPIAYGMNLSVCRDLCSMNCSCLGIFHRNSSGSCFMLENMLGSVISDGTDENDLFGYIKVAVGSPPPNISENNNENQTHNLPIVVLVLLPLTGFILSVTLCFLWRRRRRLSKMKEVKLGQANSTALRDVDEFFIPGLPKRFEYQEVEVATDNFSTQIGSGGFGAVYKGMLDKTVVAVKKITNLGVQGKKEFCTEIAVIGNIHHANLVKLKGFCAQGTQRLLVYEYMNRGSLDRTLFGNRPVLEWQERVDIALGAARGLAYLHGGCEHKIIHCDIKPENILLHDPFQAKISDFGLSKLLNPEQSGLFTTMRGTRGYLAPEWLTNSAISEKTDVYSFGMVLLELVSGRKNCSVQSQSSLDNSNSGGGRSSSSSGLGLVYFPLFALEMHEQGRYLELADPRLEGRVTSEEVEKLVRIALCCVHEEPALRPTMTTVVGMLEGGIPLREPRMESLNFLRFYGRRFTEASTLGEEMEQNGLILLPKANISPASTGSHNYASFISSQQVSGPR